MVHQDKVLYLDVSDTPAWVVSKANDYTRSHGLRHFIVYQGRWSAADRDFEREILGMCAAEGMGLALWSALGGSKFKDEKQREATKGEGRQLGWPREKDIKVSGVLEEVAKAKDTAITSVALAYVLHKAPWIFPIVGGRKIEHLKGNIEALGLELSEEDMARIEGAVDFDVGFPLNFLSRKVKGPGNVWFSEPGGRFDYVEAPPVSFIFLLSLFLGPCFGQEFMGDQAVVVFIDADSGFLSADSSTQTNAITKSLRHRGKDGEGSNTKLNWSWF